MHTGTSHDGLWRPPPPALAAPLSTTSLHLPPAPTSVQKPGELSAGYSIRRLRRETPPPRRRRPPARPPPPLLPHPLAAGLPAGVPPQGSTPQLSLGEAYEALGLREGAPYDSVMSAKNALLQEHAGDPERRSQVGRGRDLACCTSGRVRQLNTAPHLGPPSLLRRLRRRTTESLAAACR